MKYKTMKTILLLVGLVTSMVGSALTVRVKVESVDYKYTSDTEFTVHLKFLGETIGYAGSSRWRKLSSTNIIKNHGIGTETLTYLVDANFGLKIKAINLALDSKILLNWKDIESFIRNNFTKDVYEPFKTTRAVEIFHTTNSWNQWAGTIPNIAAAEVARNSKLVAQTAAEKAKAIEDAIAALIAAEEERIRTNNLKLAELKLTVFKVTELLAQTEEALIEAKISRTHSDIKTLKTFATKTKEGATKAKAIYKSLNILETDNWRYEAYKYERDMNKAGIRADDIKAEALAIVAITAAGLAQAEEAWQAQKIMVVSSLATANAKHELALGGIETEDSLTFKLALIEDAKEANALFLVEVEKLAALKRRSIDTSEVEDFRLRNQVLKSSIDFLLSRHSVLTEEAWQEQVPVVEAALTHARSIESNATNLMSDKGFDAAKIEAIEAAEEANANLLIEIQILAVITKTTENSVKLAEFNQDYQLLKDTTASLRATYEERVAAAEQEAEQKRLYSEATLTGFWKFPIIKDLSYTTNTHSGSTDELGTFKCQPGEMTKFLIENLELVTEACIANIDSQTGSDTKTTNSLSLRAGNFPGFKDWTTEGDKQTRITKVLFGLFGEAIKLSFAQNDESLKLVTIDLTEDEKARTAGEDLSANDLNLLVQNILGTTEEIVLPTNEEAAYMARAGWQADRAFTSSLILGIVPQTRSIKEGAAKDTNVGAVLATTGTVEIFEITGGNDEGYFKIDSIGQIKVAKEGLDYKTKSIYLLTVKVTDSNSRTKSTSININIIEAEKLVSKKSSGGGCVYNPNAKGGTGIEFISLLVLSMYYLIRRKRLAVT